MSTQTKRPNILVSLILLLGTIAIGAHISGIPLLLAKAGGASVLFVLYGYFAVRIVTAMQIGSTGTRAVVGLVLGTATMYVMWAIRIPAFSAWEVPFTADPKLILDAINQRASSMEVTKSFGAGTSTEGPSWLMLGTYMVEAFFFVGIMVLCSILSSPDTGKSEESNEEPASEVASVPS